MAGEIFLQNVVFTKFVLPFLLIFFIVFAILEKTKVFGEGNKQINALISFVIGLIFVGVAFPKEVVANLILFLTVALLVVFVFLILWGFVSGKKLEIESKGLKWTVGIAILVGVLVTSLSFLPNIITFGTQAPTFALGTVLVLFGTGMIYKVVSIDYVPQTIGTGTQLKPSSAQSGFDAALTGTIEDFDVPDNIPPKQRAYYFKIELNGYNNTIHQIRNAGRAGNLSTNFANSLESQYKQKIEEVKIKVSSLTEQAKRRSRKSIFEEGLGISSRPNVPIASAQSSTPPVTTSATSPVSMPATAPSPPKKSGSLPTTSPSPPGPPGLPTTSPSPPGPPGLPTTSPSPPGPSTEPITGLPGMPPSPSPTASPSSQTSPDGDVAGGARSTSIAELRGEMLKELRRLRDVFKEDDAPK